MNMKSVKNIEFHNYLYMDLFLPEQEKFFTIVHFHGGGLIGGDKGDTHQFCERLAKHGYAVYTANYSLITEKKFPEFLYDAAKAIKYAMNDISKYGKSKGIIVSGQSAGAYIALMLCFNKEYLKSVGIDSEDLVGWISDSAQPTSHFNILKYEKGLSPLLQRIDETAPLFYVDEKTKFSKLLLISYENDLPNRLEQNKLLYSTLLNFNKNANVELRVLKGGHCHGSSELDDDGEYEIIKEIIKFQ